MKATLVFFGIGAGLAILQSTVFLGLPFEALQPDLVLLATVYAAHMYGREVGQWAGFGIGLVEDATSLAPFGFHAVTRLILGSVVGTTFQLVRLDSLFLPMLLTLFGLVTKYGMTLALAWIFGLEGILSRTIATGTLVQSGVTLVLAPVVFALFRLVTAATGGVPKDVRG